MNCKETQCDPAEPQTLNIDIKSSSQCVYANKVNHILDNLSVDDPHDLDRLKQWCQSHWLSTFRKALLNRNIMQYHACCNSFSRRYFCKLAGHPDEMTISLGKVQAFKNIQCGDDLYAWLLQVAKENSRQGQRTLFPMLNRRHYDQSKAEGHEETSFPENSSSLKKRCVLLEKELEQQRTLFNDLLEDNSRLLQSSKAWHAKYEQLLETHDSTDYQIDIFSTPVKHRISNFPTSCHNSR